MLGHQVENEKPDVKAEHTVVLLASVSHPRRDILGWSADSHQSREGQRCRVSRVAKAQVVHIENAG